MLDGAVAETYGEPRIVLGVVMAFATPQLVEQHGVFRLKADASRGEAVRLTPDEEARCDQFGMLARPGASMADAEAALAHKDAVYRAERGDKDAVNHVEAAYQQSLVRAREAQRPPEETAPGRGIATFGDETDPTYSPQAAAQWIAGSRPNALETVAMAQETPERAAVLLEGEGLATAGSPRAGVVKGLQAIIDVV